MNPDWQAFLVARGAQFAGDPPELASFGDAQSELQSALSGTVLAPLAHLGVIACDGEDARTFLHNQLTSDINHLGNDRAQHAAWCTAKGRMLASFVVWPEDGGFRLTLASELLPAIVKRLRMYVLRSQVSVGDLGDSVVLLGLAGPQAATALAAAGLAAPAQAMQTTQGEGVRTIRLDTQRYLVAAPAERVSALWPVLATHARPVGLPVWRWLDVVAALPLITEATREEFVPQMADFEKIGGVSFHKGCYPGQEVVARTQYLGKVKRHLFRVSSEAPLQAGDDLHSPDNPDQGIGKIVTAAPAPEGGWAALAVIQSNFAASAHLSAADGPAIAAVPVNPCA